MVDIGYANWDLTKFFPKTGGTEQLEYEDKFKVEAKSLLKIFQRELDGDELAKAIVSLEDLSARLVHMIAYAECARAENVHNEAAQRLNGNVSEYSAIVRQIEILLESRLRQLSDREFSALKNHSLLDNLGYHLERWRYSALHSMEPELEALNAELEVTGFRSWERLYDNLAGRLEFDYVDSSGQVHRAPMSAKVSLLEDRDPEVRRSTLENSNKAWESIGAVVTACLNNIAGYRLKVQERRGVVHHLDSATFESGLSRRTLETMHSVVAEYRPSMREYLKIKAKLCHKECLGFQDLFAPIDDDGAEKTYAWEDARDIIERADRQFSPDFADFVKMALEHRWVDSEDRPGKLPGGFCTSSTILGESRIFMTYRGNYGDMATLAHELGHAYHEWLVRDMRHFAHSYPMTLAETASTFAEQLLGDYLLKSGSLTKRQRLSMVLRRLDDAATYLLNIPMRFAFEDKFYRERRLGEVSQRRISELMLETQKEIYGDALDPHQLDPWFWASKGHFYITDISFYNFPYTFGYLFSMGVYQRALCEGSSFVPKYVELLRRTGIDSCEGVARDILGVDLEKPEFWRESLEAVAKDLQSLKNLLAER